MSMIDFRRHDGLLDHDMLSHATISIVGVGGAARLVRQLAQSGITRLFIVDPDTVDETNPARQGYGAADIGSVKVHSLAHDITTRINPQTSVTAFPVRYEELDDDALAQVWDCELMLAMTDHGPTQAQINSDAIRFGKDALFAGGYPDATAVEITGTFSWSISQGLGCHRCQVSDRYSAIENGYQIKDGLAGHIFQGDLVNTHIGIIALSYLHLMYSDSDLGQQDIARRFMCAPFLTTRIFPSFESRPGETHDHVSPMAALFTTLQWPLAKPDTELCPDCGHGPDPLTG